jgi:predicted phosphohydrolase
MDLSRNNLFAPPTLLQRIHASPLKYTTRKLYHVLSSVHPPPRQDTISIACISDTHNHIHNVPDADYLIHAGDLTVAGTIAELQEQINWLHDLPHKGKYVIAGNHDSCLDSTTSGQLSKDKNAFTWRSLTYLQSEITTVTHASLLKGVGVQRKLKIFGSPWVPLCGGSDFAFQYSRVDARDSLVWRNKTFPDSNVEVDEAKILVTHTPPRYYLDTTLNGHSIGSKALLEELWRVRPRLHVFGHVHGARGVIVLRYDLGQKAYERASARENTELLELINLWAWLDLIIVFACGLWGTIIASLTWVLYLLGIWIPAVAWLAHYFEDGTGKTILVNAAMFYDQYGKTISEPRVIGI